MTHSSLLSLPDELIAAIAALIDVGSLLSLALACAETHRHVKQRLSNNKEYAAKYTIQHDRLPLTVSTFLRLVLAGNDEAWHLRAFESWGLRPGFHKWKTWTFHYGMPADDSFYELDENEQDEMYKNWPEPAQDHSGLDETYFDQNEFSTFRNIMTDDLHLPPDDVNTWMDRIREGYDEPLKGMIFALAPRLDRLNFIAYDSWQSDEHSPDHPLTFLCKAIASIRINLGVGVSWPPGFNSLRSVSVCTSTDLRHPHDSYYAQPKAIAPLFHLPNIKTLHLTLLGYHDDDGSDDMDLPPKSSSVEELQFSCCSISIRAWRHLLQAPKTLLKLNIAASGSRGDNDVLQYIADTHGPTLEFLSLDSYGDRADQYLKQFTNLKVIDRLDVLNLFWKSSDDPDSLLPRRPTIERVVEGRPYSATLVDLREYLSPGLERVAFRYNVTPRDHLSLVVRGEMLRAVADLVEDPRFKTLKSVCIRDLWVGEVMAKQDPVWETVEWDSDAMARIEARGIETHLRDERGEILSYNVHRPVHPDGNCGLTKIETDPQKGR